MTKLQGRVALVTGAGRGIGREIALKLAGDGARVVINDIDREVLEETAALVKKAGSQAAIVDGDVTAKGFAETFVGTAMEKFNGLDIIVNNAGYSWDTVIQKATDEQFDAMLDIHVRAPFRILRAAADPIRDMAKKEQAAGKTHNRKVVNIASIAALFGNAGQVGYASGKSALFGMTKTLAKEWGRYQVNVNCVAFGLIQTRMTEEFTDKPFDHSIGEKSVKMGVPAGFQDTLTKMIPLGRAGTPQDAANAVYLFCIPESDYISGEVLLASGGLVL
ncbi:MAG TPA: SDR family oxidoreductase [Hyphomicrobiales bacterium]|nr:SDR family oxidoreductase [Rhodobiaceae bacterium]HXK53611.1 SDR family oxidoreductase [Hyphomicrobiales bacterium]